ncbi:hypothetical protein AHF37_08995 [Paragonimus kellicotti]|nr:hypothetical protein AHF37_08995 [Paragonimus kellicotti]
MVSHGLSQVIDSSARTSVGRVMYTSHFQPDIPCHETADCLDTTSKWCVVVVRCFHLSSWFATAHVMEVLISSALILWCGL